jgi:hypothetical protein
MCSLFHHEKSLLNNFFRPNEERHRAWCSQTTFAEDGRVIMQPRDNFSHFVKSLLSSDLYFLRQLPDEWDVRVNVPQFLNSITMRDGDRRVGPGDWEKGPGWRATDSSLPAQMLLDNTTPDSARAQAISRYQTYYEKVAKFIPNVVINNCHKYQRFELQEGENVDTRTCGRPAHGRQRGMCYSIHAMA